MKLNKRQTKIIAASFFLVILIISTSFIVIKNVSKREEKKQVPIQPNPNGDIPNENENGKENNHENDLPNSPPLPNNNLEVEDYRKELINNVEKLLKSKNIKDESLLQKLKDSNINGLNPSETDWRNYFNSVTNKAQLVISWTIVSNLINNIPNGQNPPPSTPPSSPPTNEWERILWEIKGFMNTNPQNLQKVKDWVQKKNYSDPLAGVNLDGIEPEELKRLFPSAKPDLEIAKVSDSSAIAKYKSYFRLESVGDGNCFLNSFSVLLTGKNRDTSLSMPLRVKLCLELMAGDLAAGNESQQLQEIKEKLDVFATNGKWLADNDISYMMKILNRPITIISKVTNTTGWSESAINKLKESNSRYISEYPLKGTTDYSNLKYKEPFVIHNTGGHYEPLVRN